MCEKHSLSSTAFFMISNWSIASKVVGHSGWWPSYRLFGGERRLNAIRWTRRENCRRSPRSPISYWSGRGATLISRTRVDPISSLSALSAAYDNHCNERLSVYTWILQAMPATNRRSPSMSDLQNNSPCCDGKHAWYLLANSRQPKFCWRHLRNDISNKS